MNRWTGIGRITRDPDIRQSGETKIARYTLAVDRRNRQEGADFIPCVCFGKSADFVEKYLQKGMKIAVEGRIQTGSYEKNGQKVYTTDIIVESHEFVESRSEAQPEKKPAVTADSFMSIPVEIEDGELPFK